MTDRDPARRALIIAHEPDGTGGEVERSLVNRGFVCDTHVVTWDYDRPDQAEPFPDFEVYDLIVAMGSIRSLTAKHEISSWIHDELELIAAAHDRGTPVFGVCFGAQLIADALGGSVECSPVTEIGWLEIEAAEGQVNPVSAGPWMLWHHDRVVPPPGATVLARTDHAAHLFHVGSTVGTQFHPEVDLAHMEGFLEGAQVDYLAQYGVTKEKLLADTAANEEANRAHCAALIDWFLALAFPA